MTDRIVSAPLEDEWKPSPAEWLVRRAAPAIVTLIALLLLAAVATAAFVKVEGAVKARGSLEPRRVEAVRAAETGTVANLFVRSGDTVLAGDVLVELDIGPILEQLREAESRFSELGLDVERARQSMMLSATASEDERSRAIVALNRARAQFALRLFDQARTTNVDSALAGGAESDGLVLALARTDVREAEVRLDAALRIAGRATLDSLFWTRLTVERASIERRLDFLRSRLERHRVRSPVSGVVLTEDVDDLLGRRVSVGESVLEIGDETGWVGHLFVSEGDVGRVHVGQPVALEIEAVGRGVRQQLVGSVYSIGAQAWSGSPREDFVGARGAEALFRVIVNVDGDEESGDILLRRGISVRGRILTGREPIWHSILGRRGT